MRVGSILSVPDRWTANSARSSSRAGPEVVFSYACSKEKLNQLTRDTRGNAPASTPKEAAQGADAPLLAVHWSRLDDVLNQAGDLAGKVIVRVGTSALLSRHRSLSKGGT